MTKIRFILYIALTAFATGKITHYCTSKSIYEQLSRGEAGLECKK